MNGLWYLFLHVVLNVVLPVIIGSYYVLNLKPKQYHNDSAVHYIRTLFFAILLFLVYGFQLENQEIVT
jgi:hypothetical protein